MMSDIGPLVIVFSLFSVASVIYLYTKLIDLVKDIRSLNSDIMVLQSKEFARDDRINNLSKMVYDNANSINYLNTEVFGDEE